MLKLLTILFLIYLGYRLLQRFDAFVTGRNPQAPPEQHRFRRSRRNRVVPREDVEDAKWEDV